jgi:CRISPR/Cas system CSM-associated protein Csm3 (group 7 of RAMP superfamily)
VRYGTLQLESPGDLLTWLTLSGPGLANAVAKTPVAAPDPSATAEDSLCQVQVSIVGPWRIGSGEEKQEGDPIPMLRIAGQFVMPGSGIKGIVRSRAEYILQSVGIAACDEQKCSQCWTCRVFGYGGGDDDASPAVGRRAQIRFANAPILDAGEPIFRKHVAIDRFTGGARDTALYTMEALEAGAFTVLVEPMGSVPADILAQIRAVLRLVFEDLNDGLIGMGGGTARGYGSVRADFSSSGLPPLDEARKVLAGMREGAVVGG